MARKKPAAARTYVRHRQQPEWGTGLLVKAGRVDNTYVFADGTRRVFKAAEWHWFLDEVEKPTDAAVIAQLERGFASGGASTPKAMHLDFIAQLRANRRDGGVYLAYADWLQGQKDPRGELIVVQHQLSKKPRDAKLLAAERALLTRHADYFLPRSLRQILEQNAGCSVVWRYGFLTHVKLARRPRDYHDPAHVLADLFAHPSAELLESLALGPVGVRGDPHFMTCIEKIVEARPPLLEELICDRSNGPESRIGNIAPLFPALPGLKRLALRGHTVRISGQTKHEQLRSLSIRADSKLGVAPLVRSKFPALETLEIEMPDFTLTPADVSTMLDGKRMPKLARLVLRGTEKTRAILDAVIKSAQLPRLAELVLTEGDLPARSTELAILRESLLAHLKVVEIDGTERAEPRERTRATNRAEAARAEWAILARDDEIVWGEREGHATFVRLGTTHVGCSCDADPKPCAHVRSLQLFAPVAHTLEEREVPASFMRRLRR